MSSEEVARWYFVLRSPVRLRILKLLGERGPMPFKELRGELGLGVGTIYYHLSVMAELIERDEKKRYMLSELGMRLFTLLRQDSLPSLMRGPTRTEKALKILLISPFFRISCENKAVGIPLSLATLSLGAIGCARAGLMPVLFFYVRSSASGWQELFSHYIGQWITIFLLCEALSLAFYKQAGAELELLIDVFLASFPMGLFPYIYMVIGTQVSTWVLPFLQLWSMLLVCSAVSLGKGMRIDKAMPIGFSLMFINVFLLFFTGLLRF
mgnify:CR=1 FL=1